MNDATNNTTPATRFRFETGHDVLETWAETANQTRKNVVYKALFALVDGSLFRDYRVIEDFQRLNEVTVVLRDDMTMRIRINCFDSFGIVSIDQTEATEDAA
jgi:hypothetical protein